jgi:glycosyltransferase involved in cell wall biosynthesis
VKVSIIIPFYFSNIEKYRIYSDCFESLEKYRKPNHELIVVDDCSPLDHDFYTTVRNNPNKGYTGTVNEGLKKATGDILVVANDDILFTDELMEKLETIKDNQICLPTWLGEPKSDDDRFGFFWGLTRKTFEKLGLLDESMKHYFSDLDYYMRAKKAGVEIVKWWDTPVYHYSGATYGNNNKLYEVDKEAYRKKYGRVD